MMNDLDQTSPTIADEGSAVVDDAQVMPFARMTLRPMYGLPMRIARRG